MGAEQAAGDGANHQRANQAQIHVAEVELQEAGDAGQRDRMHNVSSYHHFGGEAVEQKEQHHDDAARADGSHPHENAGQQPDGGHTKKRPHGGRPVRDVLFDLRLKKQKRRNAYQQNPHGDADETVHPVAVNMAKVGQESYSDNRSRNTAHSQGQNYVRFDRALTNVQPAGADLGNKIEERIRSDGKDRRNS